jgi:hypothetical protein
MAGICQWLARERQQQIPSLRNDNQKDRQQQGQKQTQIPFGNDNKKTNATADI